MGRRGAAVIRRYAHQDLEALFREHLEDVVARRGLQPTVPIEVTVQYVVSALLAVLTWWLDHDVPYSAQEMSRMFQQLTHSGVPSAFVSAPTPN